MNVALLPEVANFLFWTLVVLVVVAGVIAAAVVFSQGFRRVMNL